MKYKVSLFVYLLLITILYLGFNQHLIYASWRWDDTQILLHALNTNIWDNFTNPEVWRKFSQSNLTPWLIISFKIDYFLFGFNALGYYIHHLISIIILTYLMLYLSIKLTNNLKSGFVFLIIFFTGAPLYTVTEQLMTRHYLEGMIFCLLSLIFSIKYLETVKDKYLILSLFLYVLAAISKEIYVPLIGILLLIYFQNKIINYKIIVTHLLVGIAYAWWRFFMLPEVIGGYSTGSSDSSGFNIQKYISAYFKIPEIIFGKFWILPLITILILSISYILKNRKNVIFILIALIIILLPLAPLINYPGINNPDRYLFAFWSFLSLFITISLFSVLNHINNNGNRFILFLFLLFTIPSSANQSYKYREFAILMGNEFDSHAKFIIDNNSEINLFPSKLVLDSVWFITGIFDLKKKILHKDNKISLIIDEIFIKNIEKDFWTYSQKCKCIENNSFDLENTKKILTYSIQLDKPLSVNLDIQRYPDRVEWKFGPYSMGTYEVLLPDSYSAIKFQKEGSLKIQIDAAKDISMILKYTDPTGWSTYSPLLKVGILNPSLEWKR